MTEVGMYLDATRLVVGFLILLIASYTDIKTRRASNILWVIMAIVGGMILIIQYFTGEITNYYILIFIPIMIGLVYLLFQLGLIFGGADAKALMAIAILVPTQPQIYQIPQIPIWGQSYMPAAWTIFSNSVILFLAIPVAMFLYNIFKRNIKFPYCLLGYRMKIAEAREKFVWPLEKLVDGERKFAYMPKGYDTEDEFDEFEKNGITEIWVTPKIPFMIPLLVGFIFTFVFGDILASFMQLLI
jgi:preflagellin peptidase FlaK